jgi:glycosyltransferase involved in cell wall biosynthesis
MLIFFYDVYAKPQISIITSVFNGDQFIKSFLQDITQQTIFNKCELILINANSPGNEYSIIKKFMKKYPNISYIKLKQDPGLYGVWNIGIKMAKGNFITNANLDDRLAPNCYQAHLNFLLANPQIDLVYSDEYITNQPNETFEKNTANRVSVYSEFSKQNMITCLPNAHPMWRKTIHDKYGYFDETFRSVGDWEFWLRAVSKGAQFLKLHAVLGLFYYNPKGLSFGLTDKRYFELIEICERYKKMFNLSHLSGPEVLNFASQVWQTQTKEIYSTRQNIDC